MQNPIPEPTRQFTVSVPYKTYADLDNIRRRDGTPLVRLVKEAAEMLIAADKRGERQGGGGAGTA